MSDEHPPRKRYWMHGLRTFFINGLNNSIWDEFKSDNVHINVGSKYSSLPRKKIVLILERCSLFFTTIIFR